jgi:predicted RNA-binding Zn-ribbon protein involved in translation (DUF1610 family)
VIADQSCPSCGNELPEELGVHALAPQAGLVRCPHCGESVTLDTPGARETEDEERATDEVPRADETVGGEEGAPDSFSGEETIEGVKEELEDKPGGGEARL